MIITKPNATIEFVTPNSLQLIERCGRTCYLSNDKITEHSAEKFVKMIIDRGHHSVLEHATMTARLICDRGVSHEAVRHRICAISQESSRYCNYKGGCMFILPPWVSVPEWILDQNIGYDDDSNTFRIIEKYDEEGFPEFKDDGNFLLVDSDDINEFSKEEYSFVDTFKNHTDYVWLRSMSFAEGAYLTLLKNGQTPQQARAVLPNSLKTELVITANFREWMHIFKLRTDKTSHPQMIEVMNILLNKIKQEVPVIFDQHNV